jgi:hypothetical protein
VFVLGAGAVVAYRSQWGIDDKQYLRVMIPQQYFVAKMALVEIAYNTIN